MHFRQNAEGWMEVRALLPDGPAQVEVCTCTCAVIWRALYMGVLCLRRNGKLMTRNRVYGRAQGSLRAGDVLVSVDGRDVVGLSPSDVAARITGPVHTVVGLTVVRTDPPSNCSVIKANIRRALRQASADSGRESGRVEIEGTYAGARDAACAARASAAGDEPSRASDKVASRETDEGPCQGPLVPPRRDRDSGGKSRSSLPEPGVGARGKGEPSVCWNSALDGVAREDGSREHGGEGIDDKAKIRPARLLVSPATSPAASSAQAGDAAAINIRPHPTGRLRDRDILQDLPPPPRPPRRSPSPPEPHAQTASSEVNGARERTCGAGADGEQERAAGRGQVRGSNDLATPPPSVCMQHLLAIERDRDGQRKRDQDGRADRRTDSDGLTAR